MGKKKLLRKRNDTTRIQPRGRKWRIGRRNYPIKREEHSGWTRFDLKYLERYRLPYCLLCHDRTRAECDAYESCRGVDRHSAWGRRAYKKCRRVYASVYTWLREAESNGRRKRRRRKS